ncbi:MAG: transglycosylase SLT domain-containing protein [Pseudomonadota bacterium]
MRPVFIFVLSLALWASAPAAEEEAAALERALGARAAGDWDRALAEARGAGPVGQDIIAWHYLRARQGTFAEARAFLARRPDWPGLPLLRARSEGAIPPGADARQVIDFFVPQAPRSGAGTLRYAAALRATGQGETAEAELIRGWTTHSLTASEEAAFITRHGALLRPHHWARTDMLLWRGLSGEAERMLPLLTEAEKRLATARIALRERRDGVNALIDRVPAARAGDPGLAYERFLWRARAGLTDGAIEMLEQTEELGRAEDWGNLRRRYARILMRAEENRRAYRIAARHGLSEGRHFDDLEWLAGFIALRKLGDAETALAHFERFETAVDTPISLGRAGYWQARAHAALGDEAAAMADYTRAAAHQTAFYGQLAAEEAGLPPDPLLTGTESFPDWRGAAFMQSSVFEAAELLLAAGDLSLGERFLTHLTESLSRQDIGQLAGYVREVHGEPHLEVMIAKRAVQYGHVLEAPYFPLHPLLAETGDVPPALALAIARRESEFDPRVSSGVGARGLMQLMPATAEEMAGDLGVRFIERRLLSDPDYNARLGLTYLAELQETFGESPVLISVAYNAGPSRAFAWMRSRGDPREARTDLVDWIEHIPFRETRNYVMRVTESLPVYRARLSGETEPLGLLADLRGARPDGRAVNGPPPPNWAPELSLRPRSRPAAAPAPADAPATE